MVTCRMGTTTEPVRRDEATWPLPRYHQTECRSSLSVPMLFGSRRCHLGQREILFRDDPDFASEAAILLGPAIRAAVADRIGERRAPGDHQRGRGVADGKALPSRSGVHRDSALRISRHRFPSARGAEAKRDKSVPFRSGARLSLLMKQKPSQLFASRTIDVFSAATGVAHPSALLFA